MRSIALSLLSIMVLAVAGSAGAGTVTCTTDYNLPADIPVTTSNATPSTFQEFGWQGFLGLNAPSVGGQISTTADNVPQWASWSSTVDLLLCQTSPTPSGCVCPTGGCTESGTHYYPSACESITDYENYRVLGQVNKVDDSFEEAATGGLSGEPVIDRFGGFLRYEILVSPATYDDVIEQQLYSETQLMSLNQSVNLSCGTSSYTGGDPANADMGALVTKLAWMDVTDGIQSGDIDASDFHLQQLLVYNPYYRNSTGEASCALRTMALVGMHIAHKTVNQPTWIWSTFEHNLNAPDCTGPIPAPNTQQANTSCPNSVSIDYNFYPQSCSGQVQSCASCNAQPATNGTCSNPDTTVGSGYCLDEPPASTGGISQLCRQVPISSYPNVEEWNTACQQALGTSVWSNYSLISSQWGTSAFAAGCNNVASQISGSSFSGPVNDTVILPTVAAGSAMKSLLANTSMESYDRSNCIGCHSKAHFSNDNGTALSTDLMYFLQLQVSAPAATRQAFAGDIQGSGGGGDDDDSCAIAPRANRRGAWMLLFGAAVILGLKWGPWRGGKPRSVRHRRRRPWPSSRYRLPATGE